MKLLEAEGKVVSKSIRHDGGVMSCVQWPDPRYTASKQTQELFFSADMELGAVVTVAVYDDTPAIPHK
jgi:hypothetical protein